MSTQQSSTYKKRHITTTIELLLIIAGLLCIFLFIPRVTGSDGFIRYQDVQGLIEQHTLNGPWSKNAKYSLIGPAFSVPLYLAGKIFNDAQSWTVTYNFVLFSLTLLITYVVFRNIIDGRLLRYFYLVLLTASMFPGHLGFFFGEVFSSLTIGFGLFFVGLQSAGMFSWLIIALGVANTTALLPAFGLFILKQVWDTKKLRYIVVFGVAGAFIALEALLRRGSIFANGYVDDKGLPTVMPYSGLPGFSYPFFLGLLSILFSFGKGLLFFVPGLLLPIRRTLKNWHPTEIIDLNKVYVLWLTFVIGMVLVYAQWWSWYGGSFWGPRFFLFASIPASFALAVRLRYRDASLALNILTIAVFVLSLWVGINGAVFQQGNNGMPPICRANNYELEILCHYTPDFSALWYPFVAGYQLNTETTIYIAYSLIVALYLLIPLTLHMAQQSKALIHKHKHEWFNWKSWSI